MLLIPDLHLEPTYANRIISMLQIIIMDSADDSVIFLGDYIYYFSYHKPSLLSFLSLCLACANKGKHIYILAGNHDRFGSEFVFQEAKIFVDYLTNNNLVGSVTFITKPCVMTIQGQTIAFLPSCINPDDYVIDNQQQAIYEANACSFPMIASRLQSHKDADTKNLRYSYAINNRLMYQHAENLMIIHHWYIGPCRLPGLKTQFDLDDGALHSEWLTHPTRRFISGHIHTPFILDNRACLGSFWYTSQTEYNHPKVWGHRDSEKNILTLTPVTVNPLIRLHISSISCVSDLSYYRTTYRDQRKNTAIQTQQRTIHCPDHNHCSSNELSVHLILEPGTDPKMISLLEELNNHVVKLRWSFEKEKHINITIDDCLGSSTLTTSLLNWRTLLTERIKAKYPESYELYVAILRELDII